MQAIDRDAHSKVGASGRQRWAACPGSVALVATLPVGGPQSAYAAWGSEAHGYAEKGLKFLLVPGSPKPPKIKDPEMRECVETYLTAVGQVLEKHGTQERRIWIEARFTLPGMPDAYGTVDFAVYYPALRLLYVIDLKTGGGVLVSSYENQQLLYYATALMFQEFVPVERAVLAISAPRAPEDYQWKPWEIPGTRLFKELAKLRDEILATEVANAPLVSGDHCAKSFCPAMAVCPARKTEAFELAVADFAPLHSYDPAELARCYLALDRIEAWCKAVSQFAHAEAYAGRTPPGLKLVNKRLGNRKWKDDEGLEQKVQVLVNAAGKPDDAAWDRKLKSPAQIEKLIPKGSIEMLNNLTARESTGTTLVAESDERPAAQIGNDFAPVATPKGISE